MDGHIGASYDGSRAAIAFCSAASTKYRAGQLRKSVIYDSGANQHIYNDYSRYDSYKPFGEDDIRTIEAGGSCPRVLGKGVMKVELMDEIGLKGMVYIQNALYMPEHHTSIISKGIWR
jgi:Pol polyprotein